MAQHFDQVQAVVVAGLTDVWSAIRKACAQRLHGLERNLKQEQLMQLYASCVSICQRPEGPSATWQAKEGALMGLTSIVRRFRAEIRDHTTSEAFTPRKRTHARTPSSGSLHPDAVLVLAGGDDSFAALPSAISGTLAAVGFSMLSHPQLSVREVRFLTEI